MFGGILKKASAVTDGNFKTSEKITEVERESVGMEVKENKKINCIVLHEDIAGGQNCSAYKLLLFNKNDELVKEIHGTTIGRKRIITFPAVSINTIELTIEGQHKATIINEMEAYLIDKMLIEK